MKSQGNQLTKLKVKDIELLHSIPGEEPWPEEFNVTNQNEEEFIESEDENIQSNSDDAPIEVVWDLEKPQKVKKPNPIKEDDDESELQGKLF
jgi:topoisomerase-4 subunit A